MGRWSYVHMRRKGQKPITIYTVYQVCTSPTNAIGHTAWHQQRIKLNEQGRTHIHPRQAFVADLTTSIQTFQQNNHDIIIAGDFNETTEKHNSGILKIVTTTNLVDPFLLLAFRSGVSTLKYHTYIPAYIHYSGVCMVYYIYVRMVGNTQRIRGNRRTTYRRTHAHGLSAFHPPK